MLMAVKLNDTPIVEGLSEEMIDCLVEALVEETYASGTTVSAEGTQEDKLQIIKRGTASLTSTKSAETTQLEAGDYFGESCLTKRKTRKTAVVAATQLLTISLSAEAIKAESRLDQWRDALLKREEDFRNKSKDSKAGRNTRRSFTDVASKATPAAKADAKGVAAIDATPPSKEMASLKLNERGNEVSRDASTSRSSASGRSDVTAKRNSAAAGGSPLPLKASPLPLKAMPPSTDTGALPSQRGLGAVSIATPPPSTPLLVTSAAAGALSGGVGASAAAMRRPPPLASPSGTRRPASPRSSKAGGQPATNRSSSSSQPATNRTSSAGSPATNRASSAGSPAFNRSSSPRGQPATNRSSSAGSPALNRSSSPNSARRRAASPRGGGSK